MKNLLLLLLVSSNTLAAVRYVTTTGAGSNNGTSWAHAYAGTSLQTAINESGVTEVWVATGTYKPTETTNRAISFYLKNGVAIYGGFAGGETARDSRNYRSNPTILSGDIGSAGNADNSYHIIFNNYTSSINNSAILDGFTITGGNANSEYPHAYGGGMFNYSSSPTLVNCTFDANSADYGGGLYNRDYSSPLLTNCTFVGNFGVHEGGGMVSEPMSAAVVTNCIFNGNTAGSYGGAVDDEASSSIFTGCTFIGNIAHYSGGGICNIQSSIVISDCLFIGNRADAEGGGMSNVSASPTITNCVFSGNKAEGSSGDGGGIYNGGNSSPSITNCSFGGNTAAGYGGGIYVNGGSPSVRNSILWGNDSQILWGNDTQISIWEGSVNATYSDIQGGFAGTGNISSDPLFGDADGADNIYGTSDDNCRLQSTSPCLNTGTSSGAPAKDLLGVTRGSPPDMGAYEWSNRLFYVNNAALGDNTGSNWINAFGNLQSALSLSISGDSIWVAKGTYKPTTGTDRNISFQMKKGVKIYGGFAGTESATNPRVNYTAGRINETILSGDIGTVGVNTDNSYHVIYNPSGLGLTTSAVLDGFTVSDGYGNSGAGIYSDDNGATIRNCTITNNVVNNGSDAFGGGAYFKFGTIVLENCIISHNTSSFNGGGLCLDHSSPSITNSIISQNASSQDGGGLYLNNSSPTVSNCLIDNNSSGHGGGIYLRYASTDPAFFNVTIANNTATAGDGGGGLFAYDDADGAFTNCIFWGNSANGNPNQMYFYSGTSIVLNYSCYNNSIGNGGGSLIATNNNTTADPCFTNAGNGNYHLSSTSSCLNTGLDPVGGNRVPTSDIEGRPRPSEGQTDRGVYEHINRIYVDANVDAGNENGVSWANAHSSLSSALDEATKGDQIWVARGTYKPTDGADRTKSFKMKNGAAIYGGFAGTETSIYQRANFSSGEANETILSGDIGAPGNTSDNSYHVFYHGLSDSLTSTAILDGFTITGGNANSSAPHSQGGGMWNTRTAPTLINCTFTDNLASQGGGMYNITLASPTITNCIFRGNTASSAGGGIYNFNSSSPLITNCTFSGNSSGLGGGIYLSSNSSATITNSTFTGNHATTSGGGMWISSNPIVKNVILWGNDLTGTDDISEILVNSGTPDVSFSCIQGGYAGTGNIMSNPLFVDSDGPDNIIGTSDDNLRLQDVSPCLGKGTSTNAPATDLTGLVRGDPPDIGAYENILNAPLPVELTSFTALHGKNGTDLNWQTATEVNNHGFEVERSNVDEPVSQKGIEPAQRLNDSTAQWHKIGFVKGSGSSNTPNKYSFADGKLPAGKYAYRLKQIDHDGAFKHSQSIEIEIAVPTEFALYQNHPNPFNPSTVIGYSLAVAATVTLKMYDVLGKEVETLVNEMKEAGSHKVHFNASRLASGLYFYKLTAGNFTAVKKLVLAK